MSIYCHQFYKNLYIFYVFLSLFSSLEPPLTLLLSKVAVVVSLVVLLLIMSITLMLLLLPAGLVGLCGRVVSGGREVGRG